MTGLLANIMPTYLSMLIAVSGIIWLGGAPVVALISAVIVAYLCQDET